MHKLMGSLWAHMGAVGCTGLKLCVKLIRFCPQLEAA